MNEEQIKQLKLGLSLNAAVSIYAVNRDKMTVNEAVNEAVKLVDALDINNIMATINERI